MAGARSGLWAATVLFWLSCCAPGVFVFCWSASELLGPQLHLYMKSPLIWATLAFGVGDHDKQVGFLFHTNKPVLSGSSQRGSNKNLLLHSWWKRIKEVKECLCGPLYSKQCTLSTTPCSASWHIKLTLFSWCDTVTSGCKRTRWCNHLRHVFSKCKWDNTPALIASHKLP